MEWAALHHIDLRQQLCKCTDGSRLRRPLLASDQHATDAGVDGIEKKCLFHFILADNG